MSNDRKRLKCRTVQKNVKMFAISSYFKLYECYIITRRFVELLNSHERDDDISAEGSCSNLRDYLAFLL